MERSRHWRVRRLERVCFETKSPAGLWVSLIWSRNLINASDEDWRILSDPLSIHSLVLCHLKYFRSQAHWKKHVTGCFLLLRRFLNSTWPICSQGWRNRVRIVWGMPVRFLDDSMPFNKYLVERKHNCARGTTKAQSMPWNERRVRENPKTLTRPQEREFWRFFSLLFSCKSVVVAGVCVMCPALSWGPGDG